MPNGERKPVYSHLIPNLKEVAHTAYLHVGVLVRARVCVIQQEFMPGYLVCVCACVCVCAFEYMTVFAAILVIALLVDPLSTPIRAQH